MAIMAKKNFVAEYPLSNSIKYPSRPLKLAFIWFMTVIFIVLDAGLLAFWFLTGLLRRAFQSVGLLRRPALVEPAVIAPKGEVEGASSRVCVIGIGPSGLATTKECLEQGAEVVAFDAAPSLGGVFRKAYKGGLFTSSNFFTAFSSFPRTKEELPVRSESFEEYLDYLHRFVEQFDLAPHLHFCTAVTQVEEQQDKTWRVTVKNTETGQTRQETFTHVVVCSGVNQKPSLPDLPGRDKFKGEIFHSSKYTDPEMVRGKRVLVVGLGESASDISFGVSGEAADTCIICRNGPGAVLTRYHAGMPNDIDTTRAYHCLPRKLFATPGRVGDSPRTPRWWRFKFWLESSYNLKQDDELNEAVKSVPFTRYHWMSRYGTKSTNFIWAVVQNGAQYRETDLVDVDETGAVFSDGTRYDCDAIIFCTGFQRGFPFLPEKLQKLNYRNDLWKKTLHPEYGARLSFIGFARPNLGAIPPIAELQARYVALAIVGRLTPPAPSRMREKIAEERQYEEWLFPYDAERLPSLCSYLETLTGWARLIGCDVPLGKLLLTDPALFHRIVFGPILPAQFRLYGEGANYEKAREALMITGLVPLMAKCYKAFLMLIAMNAANLGLSDPPIGFETT